MPLDTLNNKFQHKKSRVYQFTICKEGSMGTPIVKGLTEVHHCATYSPPRPIYGLCRVLLTSSGILLENKFLFSSLLSSVPPECHDSHNPASGQPMR